MLKKKLYPGVKEKEVYPGGIGRRVYTGLYRLPLLFRLFRTVSNLFRPRGLFLLHSGQFLTFFQLQPVLPFPFTRPGVLFPVHSGQFHQFCPVPSIPVIPVIPSLCHIPAISSNRHFFVKYGQKGAFRVSSAYQTVLGCKAIFHEGPLLGIQGDREAGRGPGR